MGIGNPIGRSSYLYLNPKGGRIQVESEETRKKKSQYISKWMSQNTMAVQIRINRNKEQDLLEYMSTIENKSEYIKGLIRKDMESKKGS